MTGQNLPNGVRMALANMLPIMESKGHDYALDEDPFKTFRTNGELFGMTAAEACLFFVEQKQLRLANLRQRGSAAKHESVADTFLDLAVYALLAYGAYLEQTELRPQPGDDIGTDGAPE